MAKPAPPHAIVLGDARVTINAIVARVFEALTNAHSLGTWWGKDVLVDAQIGGCVRGDSIHRKSGRNNHRHRWTGDAHRCVADPARGRKRGDERRVHPDS